MGTRRGPQRPPSAGRYFCPTKLSVGLGRPILGASRREMAEAANGIKPIRSRRFAVDETPAYRFVPTGQQEEARR